MNNMYIEVNLDQEAERTIAEAKSFVVPRVGEVIDISEAEKSKNFGEVVVKSVSYKVTHEGTEVWIKADSIDRDSTI